MAFPDLKKRFAGRAAAVGLGALAAVTPLSYSFADDARPAQIVPAVQMETSIKLVEDAGRTANLYSRENAGIAVGVFLGTESTIKPEQIKAVLTADFQKAGLNDPVTFFFEQNDVPATGVDYHFGGDVRGPYSLGEARPAVADIAATYNWRKQQGLLAAVSYNQQ